MELIRLRIIVFGILIFTGLQCKAHHVDDTNTSVSVKQSLKKVYNIVNNSIDYMLTTKGAVKTIVVLTPFLMLYCRYFDSSPIQSLINKIVQFASKTKELIEIQKEIGKSQAFWEAIAKQPVDTILITTKKILEKTVYIGIPFVAGILTKVLLETQK